MNRPRLDVLVLADRAGEASIAAALRRRGHSVRCARSVDEALEAAHEVLVGDLDLGPGEKAFELLEVLRARGSTTRAVLFGQGPGAADFRRALRLGVADLLPRPFLLEELVRAVEACAPAPLAPAPALPGVRAFQRDVQALPDHAGPLLRDLCAFLVRNGLPPSVRARICGACHELLDNAARHAFAPGEDGRVQIAAHVTERGVRLEVRDAGRGFRAAERALHGPGGLVRAAALAEELELSSRPGGGTRATLAFSTWGADLGDGDVVDLTEHDHLSPGLARRVLESVAIEPPPVHFQLSPALAVVVGRLLAGRSERQAAEQALWSRSA